MVSRCVQPGHHEHDRRVGASRVPAPTSAGTRTAQTTRGRGTWSDASEVEAERSHADDERRQTLQHAVRLHHVLLTGGEFFFGPELDYVPSHWDIRISIVLSYFHRDAVAYIAQFTLNRKSDVAFVNNPTIRSVCFTLSRLYSTPVIYRPRTGRSTLALCCLSSHNNAKRHIFQSRRQTVI